MGFGIGGFFAVIGIIFGLIIGINSNRLGKLGKEIESKPTKEQIINIQAP